MAKKRASCEREIFRSWEELPVLLDLGIVCQFIGCSRQTINKWVNERGLPCLRFGGVLRFDKNELRGWMQNSGGAE